MSTFKKLAGSQWTAAKQRRIDAMKFFTTQTRLPPPMGFVAAAVLRQLKKIHRDPTLNGLEKNEHFKRAIQTAHRAGTGGDAPVAAVPSVPADEGGAVPAVAEPDDAAE